MSVDLVIAAAMLSAASGLPSLLCGRTSDTGHRLSAIAMVLASGLGLAGAIGALLGAVPSARSIPGGSLGADFSFAVDGLSAIFLLAIFVVSAMSSIYGLGYWPQSAHPGNGRKLRLASGLLTAGMTVVVTAKSSIVLLCGWEVMAVSAYFLIATEDGEERVRSAAWTYLVATHFGTLALFSLFALLAAETGSLELAPLPAEAIGPALGATLFLLTLVGFGAKAGLMPLHFWLPSAHANAPSHVSALLSGVMIKMGIYGILRITALVPDPPLWWGILLVAQGSLSALIGASAALGQGEMKRVLAYSSIENIGLITIGVGFALMGRSLGRPEWVALGLGGALLHLANHSLFKSLLFFGAGSVLHSAGTGALERLGGLSRAMPWTAASFAIGCSAVCALPGVNGCASEWLLSIGLFHGATAAPTGPALVAALGIGSMAIVGALALAGFVRIFAMAFLGTARAPGAAGAHEAGPSMRLAMAVPALLCVAIGVLPGATVPALGRAISAWSPALPAAAGHHPALDGLPRIGAVGAGILLVAAAAGLWLRGRARAGTGETATGRLPAAASREVAPQGGGDLGTWDCGYFDATSPRLQYTASSFSQLLTSFFRWGAAGSERKVLPAGAFPPRGSFERSSRELLLDGLLVPHFSRWALHCSRLRILQRGKVQVYILYILLILLLLIAWAALAPGSGS